MNLRLEVIESDCRDYLQSPFCPQFDLIVADPPFNIGQKYQGYKDKVDAETYGKFTFEWIRCCWNRLKPGRVLFAHGDIKTSRLMMRALFALNLDGFIENEIVWAYNFGQHTYDKFVDTHCRAFAIRKPGTDRRWNFENVKTPSKRLLMGDKRVEQSEHKGYVPFGTVWGLTHEAGLILEPVEAEPNWGRVQGNNRERRAHHPNQLPERYIERVILAYTNEFDLVCDPFAGSGTTITVCQALNRQCVTTDTSESNCLSVKQRLWEGTKNVRRSD